MSKQKPTDPIEILEKRSYRIDRKRALIRYSIILGIFTVCVIVLLNIFGVAKVNRSSMEPTLNDGDFVIIKKTGSQYGPGDVIVYRSQDGKNKVKRIVASEGSEVDFSEDRVLLVNGQPVLEENIYYPTDKKADSKVNYPFIVPKDSVFVLGDNRTSSIDSRDSGAIREEDIIGRVIFSIRKTS